jgi:hypothetical protein
MPLFFLWLVMALARRCVVGRFLINAAGILNYFRVVRKNEAACNQ